jgi:hypothetical protein
MASRKQLKSNKYLAIPLDLHITTVTLCCSMDKHIFHFSSNTVSDDFARNGMQIYLF